MLYGPFNPMTPPYRHRNPHDKDKMVSQLSYLYTGNMCTWKMIFILKQAPGTLISRSLGTTFFLAQALQWRYSNGCDGVSNHRRPGCLLNHLFWCRSKKTSKALRHWPLWGEFTGDRWIPLTRASNAENVCIWWHHHGLLSVEQDFSQWETNGLMKKRCNSSVLAMELHLFCIKPLTDIV